MIFTITIALLGTALVIGTFWHSVLAFLNGPVRDTLERLFGASSCGWYVSFLQWCDNKIVAARQTVQEYWDRFRSTVLGLKSRYIRNADGSYTKRTETFLRASENTAKHTVVEETIPWHNLPDSVRDEMLRQRTNTAELDDREVVREKVRERAAEDGITLTF